MDKIKILIVEDEDPMRGFIKSCLERFIECQIHEARNGKGAIVQMKANDFDLVILDIKLPGGNGIDVMEEVRKEKKLPDILIVTGYDSEQIATAAVQKGAVDYLPKPFALEPLMLRVKNILEKKGKYIEKTEN